MCCWSPWWHDLQLGERSSIKETDNAPLSIGSTAKSHCLAYNAQARRRQRARSFLYVAAAQVRRGAAAVALLAAPAVQAAEIDGTALGAWWGLPFAGMLLSIALMPLLAPRLWHHHYGKLTAG